MIMLIITGLAFVVVFVLVIGWACCAMSGGLAQQEEDELGIRRS